MNNKKNTHTKNPKYNMKKIYGIKLFFFCIFFLIFPLTFYGFHSAPLRTPLRLQLLFTSVGVLSLKPLSTHYMDLSDQLRVATHPCPTGLRRIVQSQLSAERVYWNTEIFQPEGVSAAAFQKSNKHFLLIFNTNRKYKHAWFMTLETKWISSLFLHL